MTLVDWAASDLIGAFDSSRAESFVAKCAKKNTGRLAVKSVSSAMPAIVQGSISTVMPELGRANHATLDVRAFFEIHRNWLINN
jgi:hypothetical protein